MNRLEPLFYDMILLLLSCNHVASFVAAVPAALLVLLVPLQAMAGADCHPNEYI